MNTRLLATAAAAAFAFAAVCTPGSSMAGPTYAVTPLNVCSLLSSGEAASIMGDNNVAMRGGIPGFMCAWNSPGGEFHISHDIAIMLFTKANLSRFAGRPLSGADPALAAALRSGAPRNVFQAMSKEGQSCQGYSGKLPCTEIAERIALYKRAGGQGYVVLIFAQRNEGHGDAGIIRLTVDAAHVANHITPRLP